MGRVSERIHYETQVPERRLYALLRNCRNLTYRPYVGWHTVKQLISHTDLDEDQIARVTRFIAREFLMSISPNE
jgi:hypothetical protein